MPISSGAEGHVGVGVDTSIKWIPEGSKDYERLRNRNSYLQRYLLQHAMDGNENQGRTERQSSTERFHNTQDKHESTKQSSTIKKTGQSRNNQSNAHDIVHKTSKTFPTTTEHKKNTSINGSAKKSSTCAIL